MAQSTETKLNKRFDQNIEITGTLTVGDVVVSPSTYLTSIPSEYLTQTEGDARYLQSFTVPSEYLTETEGDAKYLLNTTDTFAGKLTVSHTTSEYVAQFTGGNDTNVIIGHSSGSASGEQYISYTNGATAASGNAWMVGMDDDENFKFAYGTQGEINGSTNVKATITQSGNATFSGDFNIAGNLDVDGYIDATRENTNVAAPSTSDHTQGTRIKLYDANSTAFYAIGIENDTMWFNSDENYKWYKDAVEAMSLTGSNLTINDIIIGEGAYSTNSDYVGMKTAYQSGVNDYMILSGKTDGNTFVSAKDGATVFIRGGGNYSNYEIAVPDGGLPYIGASSANHILYGGNYTSWITKSYIDGLGVDASLAAFMRSYDTRSSASTPQTYNASAGIHFDFKQNSTNGLSDGGTYNGVMYWRKYGSSTDWSGGGAKEIAYTDNGNLWHRYGTGTSWGSWRKVLDSSNYSSYSTFGSPLTIKDSNPYIQWQNSSGTRLGYIQHNETDLVMSVDTGDIILDGQTEVEGTFTVNHKDVYNQGIKNDFVSTYVTRTKFGRVDGNASCLELIYNIAGAEQAIINRAYANAELLFQSTGNTQMVLNKDGDLGIGTTSPEKMLQLGKSDGTNQGSLRIYHDASGDYVDYFGYGIEFSRDYNYIRPNQTSNRILLIGNSSLYWPEIQQHANEHNWYNASGSFAMRLRSNGYLGIGVTDADAPLTLSSNTSANALNIRGRSDNIGEINFKSNNNASILARVDGRSSGHGLGLWSWTNDTKFYNDGNQTLRITPSGYIDQLNTSAAFRLYDGSTFIGGIGNGNWAYGSTWNGYYSIYANSSELLMNAGGGSTPTMMLNSNGSLKTIAQGGFSNDNDDNGRVNFCARLTTDSTFLGAINQYGYQVYAVNIGSSSNSSSARGIISHFTKTDGTWRETLCLDNGKVGINRGNAAHKLDLTGDMRITDWTYFHDGTNYLNAWGNTSSGSYSSVGQAWVLLSQYGGWHTQVLVDYDTGNMGIGTQAPSSKLHVNGRVQIDNPSYTGGQNTNQSVYIVSPAATEYFTMGYKQSARSGEVMHRNNNAGASSAFYIEAGAGEAGGICLDQDSVNVYGSSDVGTTFRVIDKDSDVVTFEMLQSSWNGVFRGDVIAYGSMSSISDKRIKENIEPYENVLDRLCTLGVYSYNKITAPKHKRDKKEIGVIAQEMQVAFPELVETEKVDKPEDANGLEEILTVDYEHLTAILLQSIKELSNKVEELENKLNGTK